MYDSFNKSISGRTPFSSICPDVYEPLSERRSSSAVAIASGVTRCSLSVPPLTSSNAAEPRAPRAPKYDVAPPLQKQLFLPRLNSSGPRMSQFLHFAPFHSVRRTSSLSEVSPCFRAWVDSWVWLSTSRARVQSDKPRSALIWHCQFRWGLYLALSGLVRCIIADHFAFRGLMWCLGFLR